MINDWTDAWINLLEDSFTMPEEAEEPISQLDWDEYYASIYADWYDTQTEERYQTERQTQTEREDWDELDWNGT